MAMSKPFPFNAWYPAAWSHEVERKLSARTVCGKDIVLYRRTGRRRRRARGRLLAPAAAAVARPARRRRGRLRLPRPRLQFGRPLHPHAGAEDDQSVGLRARLSGRRAASSRLGLAGRSGAGRSRAHARFPLERRAEWKGEGGTFYSLKCDWRLVVDNLMDLTHETYVHSDSIGHDAILDTPFDVTHGESDGDDDALDDRHRAAAVLGPKQLGKPGRVDRWQIVTFQAPGGGGRRRRRRADGDRGAAGRPFAGRQRRLPRRHRARDRDELPLFLEFRAHFPHRRR